MYLILAKALTPWVRLPAVGNVGFTALFVLFALSHCLVLEGAKRTLQFFVVSSVISYLMEETGMRTGLIFGAYHYGHGLGARLGHVPFHHSARLVHDDLSLQGAGEKIAPGNRVTFRPGDHSIGHCRCLGDDRMGCRNGPRKWAPARKLDLGKRRRLLRSTPSQLPRVAAHHIPCLLGYRLAMAQQAAYRHHDEGCSKRLPILVYGFYALRYVTANQFPQLQLIALFSMGIAPRS